jgi:Resolvase, N terminal domain
MAATALPGMPSAGQAAGGDMLALRAEATGRRRAAGHGLGRLRFAFYGRVSTEDWQDPVTSRARQRDQAVALVAGHGRIVAEFFDTSYSRTLAWAGRPQAAALVAALADPDRGWDAVVIGEYERAFYGGQYPAPAGRPGHPAGGKQYLPARPDTGHRSGRVARSGRGADRPAASRRHHAHLRPGHAGPADGHQEFPSRHCRLGNLTTHRHQEGGQP